MTMWLVLIFSQSCSRSETIFLNCTNPHDLSAENPRLPPHLIAQKMDKTFFDVTLELRELLKMFVTALSSLSTIDYSAMDSELRSLFEQVELRKKSRNEFTTNELRVMKEIENLVSVLGKMTQLRVDFERKTCV